MFTEDQRWSIRVKVWVNPNTDCYLEPQKVKTRHNVFWALHIVESVDDFGGSFTILLGDENYGQASIKCLDLACDVELAPLKICKDLTSKLEVKYFFPT